MLDFFDIANGINDYSINGETGDKCLPTDADVLAKVIDALYHNPEMRNGMGAQNKLRAQKYNVQSILPQTQKTYQLEEYIGEFEY